MVDDDASVGARGTDDDTAEVPVVRVVEVEAHRAICGAPVGAACWRVAAICPRCGQDGEPVTVQASSRPELDDDELDDDDELEAFRAAAPAVRFQLRTEAGPLVDMTLEDLALSVMAGGPLEILIHAGYVRRPETNLGLSPGYFVPFMGDLAGASIRLEQPAPPIEAPWRLSERNRRVNNEAPLPGAVRRDAEETVRLE